MKTNLNVDIHAPQGSPRLLPTPAAQTTSIKPTFGDAPGDLRLLTRQIRPSLLQPARETEEWFDVGQQLRFDDDGCPNHWPALPLA